MGKTPVPEADTSTLITHLRSVLPKDGTREVLITSVIPTLLQSITGVAEALRASCHVAAAGTANTFGDDQLNVDVTADNVIREALTRCPSIVTASSEEDPVERPVQHSQPSQAGDEQYTLAFDPLDGSSIISANWTVGTIMSLWDGPTALNQDPATKQVGAILGVLGPRTTAIIALRIQSSDQLPTCFEVALDPSNSNWHVTRPALTLTPRARNFAPANLRSAAEPGNAAYMKLIADHYIASRRLTLRYAGGLVPDITHALVAGQGVYLNPVTANNPAKLRRLYELCPIALVIECAGGAALDPVSEERVLAREMRDCGEKGGLVCGSAEEVEEAVARLAGGARATEGS
ncbi:hypothetical protein VTI28DRAFT_6363 [Corynascus sepedonium]